MDGRADGRAEAWEGWTGGVGIHSPQVPRPQLLFISSTIMTHLPLSGSNSTPAPHDDTVEFSDPYPFCNQWGKGGASWC